MKIGIDYIATIGGGGNSTYSKSLIGAITEMDDHNHYYMYVYWHDYLLGRLSSGKQPNIHWRPAYISSLGLPIPQGFVALFNSLSLRLWAKFEGIDLIHFTNPLNFIRGLNKFIVTIHDLSSFHDRDWVKEGTQQFLSKSMKEILDLSSGIVSVSEYTKQDIVNISGTDENKITTIYEAADSKKYYPDYDPEYLKGKFNIASYVLYIGELQPRKNIINILNAYAGLSYKLKQEFPLVIVGSTRDSKYTKAINETIKNLQLANHVKLLGYLEDNIIRKLYSGARVFVFPSLFEGFGLPVLEALQCGTPVITSNTTSLPEVAGDAGVLVDPEDTDEIVKVMEKILTDEDFYNNIKSRSLSQAKKFSWEKAARETIAVYEKVFS